MHFSALAMALAALTTASAQQVKVHVVKVSSSESNTLTFQPNNLKAAVGEMVQFQFGIGNHSVTQSNFDNPCVPLSISNASAVGIHSGFMPVAAGDTSVPTYTIPIKAETPMWLYCANARHCQGGMVMAINENTTKNATRSLENYISSAGSAPENVAPAGGAVGGEDGEADEGDSPDSGSEGGDPYGGGSGGGGDDNDDADATETESDAPISTGAAGRLGAGVGAGVVAVVFAMML